MGEETQISRVGRGAAETAPTAPHATPRQWKGPATGPEKFWNPWRVRVALGVGFVLSVWFHYAVGPWSVLPEEKLEFREVEGELTIPVEAVTDPVPEPPPPPPEKSAETPGGAGKHGGAVDAGAAARDAGASDGEAPDGESDAASEGGDAAEGDGASQLASDAAIALAGEAGTIPGANGPRDPTAMVGVAGNVQAGPPLVQLLVNMEVIRQNPTGARMGPLLSAIPQWDDFMSGTKVDPVRDTDWVFITGPSLIHTERDAILIHYSAPDAVVDKAIDIVAHKYARGGPFDAGVPGVRASLGHADFAARVFLRPQPHLLAVVPPDYANTAARALQGAKVSAHVRPGEAMRLTLQNPNHPMPFIPASIREMRLWIVPRPDGGADVFGEGDCPDAAAASAAADEIKRLVSRQNSIGVRIVTQGLLNTVEVIGDGAVVRLKAPASPEQLDAILNVVAAQLGANIAPAGPQPPPPKR